MMKRLDLRHIVCPIDFSGQFRSSLAYAGAIARAHAAELRTLHVVPSEGAAVPDDVGYLRRAPLMQRLRQALAAADPTHDLRVRCPREKFEALFAGSRRLAGHDSIRSESMV